MARLMTLIAKFKSLQISLIFLAVSSMAFGTIRQVGSGQTYTTIQSCLNAAVAGDTCNVHAGTYNEQVSFKASGTTGNPITLQANSGDAVTVTSSSAPVISVGALSYLTINGLGITYTGSSTGASGIGSSGNTNHITVSNNNITMNGGGCSAQGGFYLNYGDSNTISGNTVYINTTSACDGGEFLLNSNLLISGNTVYGNANSTTGKLEDGFVVSGTNIEVVGNTIHDGYSYNTHPDGIVVQGDGDRNGNLTANVKVWRNTVYDYSQGIYFDAIHNPLSGTNWIVDNVIYETTRYQYPTGTFNKMNAITIDGENVDAGNNNGCVASTSCPVNALVYNNVIDARQLGIQVLRQGATSAIDIKNNVFVNTVATNSYICIASPGCSGLGTTSTAGITMDYDYVTTSASQPIRWANTSYSRASFASAGLGEVNGRSGSIGALALNGDYTESANSDSRNFGLNLYSLFTVDRADNPRPSGGSWDMGAFQYSPTSSLPAPPTNLTAVVN